jgi:hypothetical protein
MTPSAMTRLIRGVAFALAWVAFTGCQHKQPPSGVNANRLHVDFRTEPNYEQSFRLADPGQREFVTADARGLRIELPGGTSQPVGVVLRRDLVGDFAATVKYELTHAESGRDWGSGFQFFLQLDHLPDGDGLTIARQARGGGQTMLFQHMATRDGKRVPLETKLVPVKNPTPAGAFDVKREGSKLAIKYSVGGGPPDQELGTFEIGDSPVVMFRLAANPEARGKFPVEVRVLDLDLTAGSLPAETELPQPPRLPLLIAVVVVCGLIVLAAIVGLMRRRRPAAVQEPPGGG